MKSNVDRFFAAQTRHLSGNELEEGYKALCRSMLSLSAKAFRTRAVSNKTVAEQRRAAKSWMSGDEGLITFREACEAASLDYCHAANVVQQRLAESPYTEEEDSDA